jgi:hypothetical protein
MELFQVIVALAVIAAAAGIAVRAAYEPVVLPEEAPAAPGAATSVPEPTAPQAPAIVSTPVASEAAVGVPVLNPDPDRLIQTAVMVPADGRGGAIFRLVTWVVVTGALIGLSFLAALRAVGALFG